jgi:hypothetical protein
MQRLIRTIPGFPAPLCCVRVLKPDPCLLQLKLSLSIRSLMFLYLFIYFWQCSGPLASRQVLYHLSHAPSLFCFGYYFLNRVLCLLPWAGLRLQSLYLHLWSSWDDRCPSCSTINYAFLFSFL